MSFSEWKKCKLGEVAKVQTGPFGSQLHVSDYITIGVPVVMPVNIDNQKIDHLKIMRVNDDLAKSLSKHRISSGDIIFSRRGDVERHAFAYNENVGWLCGTGCLKVTVDNNNFSRFVSYQLLLPEKKKWLTNHAVGTTMPNLNTTILSSIPIELPNIITQKKIASILSSLDDKIELNRQTNQTLETMAQTLFKEMCLPKGDELPEGWKVGKLEELGVFKNGINYSRDENGDTEYAIVNVRDVVENKFLLKENLSKIRIDKKKAKPYLLEVDDIVIVRSANPGEAAILFFSEENIIYSGFTIRYRINDKKYFLYYFFIFQALKNHIDNMSNGTTLKNVNQEMLKSYKIIIPDEKSILNFNMNIEPIFKMILSNLKEIQTLTKLRDSLLPKLMKGEIDVIHLSA